MKTLGLVMIVKNEERCLAKCLRQVKALVDKIYITDTGSTDKTKEIAASFGAIISDYVWNQDFSAARNFALSQSDCDWNLVLDADEYLIQGSRADIEKFMDLCISICILLTKIKGKRYTLNQIYNSKIEIKHLPGTKRNLRSRNFNC